MSKKKREQRELEFNLRWGGLAIYNSEVARGIVHTKEYDENMARIQEEYEKYLKRSIKVDDPGKLATELRGY